MQRRSSPPARSPGRGQAYPPRRFVELAQELDLLGSTVALGSICGADFSDFLERLLARLRPLLEDDGCL